MEFYFYLIINFLRLHLELTGELLIRSDGFGDKWKSYLITLSDTSIFKSKPGRPDQKKILSDFHWTSSCVEVAPTEYVEFRNDQPRPKIKRDFCFKVSSAIYFSRYGHCISTSMSTIYFVARDQQERLKWIQAITFNMENYKKTPQCIEKHNNLVKEMKDKFGANWNALATLDSSNRVTSSDPKSTPLNLNSTISTALNINRAFYTLNTPDSSQESGMTKKELEMKVVEQDMEISRLKTRLEALERTVTELAKLIPKQ